MLWHLADYPKRLIEVDLPIKRISAHARREKAIRHGHISTLHIWWARRPLAACRAVILAVLWPDPADEQCPPRFPEEARKTLLEARGTSVNVPSGHIKFDHDYTKPRDVRAGLLDFIAEFSNWDNSTNPDYLKFARHLVQVAHESLGGEPGTRPLVVDPFAGGGSIPLEALRVGADAFASDLNPVAVLLNKVVLEYIPKYGHRLADEVRKWGAWIKEQAEKELAEFYPKDPDGATPIAYLWARTIKCEGPGCGAEVPLIRSGWLSRRQSIGLEVIPEPQSRRIRFGLRAGATEKDMQCGTVRRGTVTCPCCGFTTSRQRVEDQVKQLKVEPTLLAVVLESVGSGKRYRLATENDLKVVARARAKSDSRELQTWIPDEELPYRSRSHPEPSVQSIRTYCI
jgi:adenine-specific DNA methylase